ncbi:hypothetical protein HOT75_gp081 [Gordonia phage Daredevil]|uniref:Uncharacterized protein n=1 Tax=Gordonia phage Daredevil TaxID=2283286 RepID=A0A345MIT7_9CAUD|nr:hypothetical protein HOT75_gp081 [Gordonia phage Daredevil]AXH70468.1 hypothetical protein SEA_DAREDEVIL_81 [Gordonia phage Daredevil]
MATIYDSSVDFGDNSGYEDDDWEGSDYIEEYAPDLRDDLDA